ncbi:fimbrial protein [Variovorax sp. YR216]|uniref:fimbrial protein n=1 Tax=Variovorax sp. YR216 TaxID=1882828 RepID=UPI00089B809F|nr:fimbrial protein [Variovorax sp. YR216]SEB21218.1 Pilin (type 1 fimbria component protein) [Variovorax sp. YR216]
MNNSSLFRCLGRFRVAAPIVIPALMGAPLLAHAQNVQCASPAPTLTVQSAWAATNRNPMDVAKNTEAINTAKLLIAYAVTKLDSGQAAMSLHIGYTSLQGSEWVAAANAVRFNQYANTAKGFGMRMTDVTTPNSPKAWTPGLEDPVFGNQVSNAGINQTTLLATSIQFDLVRLDDLTTPGTLRYFGGNGVAFNPRYIPRGGGPWTNIPNCALGVGIVDFGRFSMPEPPPPPPPKMACTFNGGNAINIHLPQVYVGNLVTVGQPPAGNYPKVQFPLRYSCETGGVVNPNYVLQLNGNAAPSGSSALATNLANVGVKVEAVSSRGGAAVTLEPNTTQMPLYDAGAAGGSTMTLVSYPVRTQSGAITAGSFQAEGTLEVFSN